MNDQIMNEKENNIMKPNKKYLSFYYEDITEVPDFYCGETGYLRNAG